MPSAVSRVIDSGGSGLKTAGSVDEKYRVVLFVLTQDTTGDLKAALVTSSDEGSFCAVRGRTLCAFKRTDRAIEDSIVIQYVVVGWCLLIIC